MNLSELLDLNLLQNHIDNRRVSMQRHPTMPLQIFNYTQLATFEPCWGDGTIDYCRGLIVDESNNVVARPFKKFHNLNTSGIPETLVGNLPPWNLSTVTEKMDGSLGILYHYGRTGIATRGSFVSEQAQWASEWYAKNCPHPHWPTNYTALFEIIYPANRIVVSYPFEGLVLLALIDRETGRELNYNNLEYYASANNMRCVRNFSDHSLEDLLKINRPNEEGFVVTFDTGLKVKIKMADYVRLHKLLTGMNPRSVWEMLSGGGPQKFLDIVNDINTPSHFIKWLLSWEHFLKTDFGVIKTVAEILYKERPYMWVSGPDDERRWRKEFALYVQKNIPEKYQSLMFMMYDQRTPEEIDQAIWKMIKPRGDDKSFRVDGE